MRTAQGRALFGGVAAQTFRPLHYPMTSAIGLGILTAGHRHGWPVAAGGSASITTALAAMLTDLGGKIETGVPIQAASQLPPADATLFDLAPESVAAILADRLPPRIQRAYSRFRREPGALKVDFAVEGGVPWTNPHARRAGTVHLGGSTLGHRCSCNVGRAFTYGRSTQQSLTGLHLRRWAAPDAVMLALAPNET